MIEALVRRDRGAEEQDDLTPRIVAMIEQRRLLREGLQGALGTVFREVTLLAMANGQPPLGPAQDRHGRVLRWSVWAPHRLVLIDLFPGVMPPPEELLDRNAWAEQHGLRYAVVEPGKRLTLRSLREWLDG